MPTSDEATGFDRHLFTQIGLDSGALTRLAVVVHSEPKAGEYRGTAGTGDLPEATFTVSVDPTCAVAQVDIDLAALTSGSDGDCGCGGTGSRGTAGRRFVVHPRGHIVFRVGSGPGGHHVNLRRADEDPKLAAYDSRRLQPGDIFSGMVLRPGTYAVRNDLSGAQSRLRVPYLQPGEKAYVPPPPLEGRCGEQFEPDGIELAPLQGLNLEITAPARVVIELEQPDDGPAGAAPPRRKGWRKPGLTP